MARDTHHVNFFLLSLRDSRLSRRACRPKLVEANDPSVRLRPRPNPLFCLENVVFNDFIDDELNSEDVTEQRASTSLPESVPIESEEERAAREADEMAALDAVGRIMRQTQM